MNKQADLRLAIPRQVQVMPWYTKGIAKTIQEHTIEACAPGSQDHNDRYRLHHQLRQRLQPLHIIIRMHNDDEQRSSKQQEIAYHLVRQHIMVGGIKHQGGDDKSQKNSHAPQSRHRNLMYSPALNRGSI